jgi:hypothetical protein
LCLTQCVRIPSLAVISWLPTTVLTPAYKVCVQRHAGLAVNKHGQYGFSKRSREAIHYSLSLYVALFLSRSKLFLLSTPPHTHNVYPIYLNMLPERIADIRKTQPKNCQNPISHFRENRLEVQTDKQTKRQTNRQTEGQTDDSIQM